MRRALEGFGGAPDPYRSMFESAPDGIVVTDRIGSFLEANDKALEMFGYARGELLDLSPSFDAGKILRKDGSELFIEAHTSPLEDGRNLSILRDVTALRRSEQKYKSMFDNNQAAIFRFTGEGRFLDCNRAFARVFKCGSIGEVMQKSITDFYFEPHSHLMFMQYLRRRQSLTDVELHLRANDGARVLALANVVLLEEDGVEVVQGTLIDITERTDAEDRLAASLCEKDILLKEVHHRVKNNLQIISSLLSLQADYIDDARALELFRECQERIESIALLHESLYKSDDLASIDMPRYIRSLAAKLMNTLAARAGSRIRMDLKLKPLALGLNSALPCALIITEVLTNSIKYAFPDDREGEIYIHLDHAPDARVTLTIGDTGKGIPEDMALGKSDSLGMQLVETLVQQLRGKVAISGDCGTRFEIQFTPASAGGRP